MTPVSHRLSAFVALTPDDVGPLEGALRRRRVIAGGADLVGEGYPTQGVNAVLSGWGVRYKTLEDGRRQIVGFVLPGDVCDAHMFLLDRMDHSIGALTDLTVAEMSRDDFTRLLADRPRLAQAISVQDLVTAATAREWIANVGRRSASERIAHLILELHLRLQEVGLASPDGVDWPLTQYDLADATGMTAIHVNRTLGVLRKSGLVAFTSRRMRILDMNALQGLAMFDPGYLYLPAAPGPPSCDQA